MKRIDGPEWMDEPRVPAEAMDRVLWDLRRINMLFGGVGPLLKIVWPQIERAPGREVSILDVAGGDGFLLRTLVDRARRSGITIRGVVLDLNPAVVDACRRACTEYPEIRVQQGDALSLPFSDGSLDYALSCLALHHFGRQNAPLAIREMRRVARFGLVVNDLRRSWLAYGITRLTLPLLGAHPITRRDGPVSVQRSFTRSEYRQIMQESAVEGLRYRECLWFRSVVWWTDGIVGR